MFILVMIGLGMVGVFVEEVELYVVFVVDDEEY